jgi:hypothetical protein
VNLLTDITQRQQAEKKVANLLKFQTLLTEISNRFINVPVGYLDKEMIDAQRRICGYLELDLSTIIRYQG